MWLCRPHEPRGHLLHGHMHATPLHAARGQEVHPTSQGGGCRCGGCCCGWAGCGFSVGGLIYDITEAIIKS